MFIDSNLYMNWYHQFLTPYGKQPESWQSLCCFSRLWDFSGSITWSSSYNVSTHVFWMHMSCKCTCVVCTYVMSAHVLWVHMYCVCIVHVHMCCVCICVVSIHVLWIYMCYECTCVVSAHVLCVHRLWVHMCCEYTCVVCAYMLWVHMCCVYICSYIQSKFLYSNVSGHLVSQLKV